MRNSFEMSREYITPEGPIDDPFEREKREKAEREKLLLRGTAREAIDKLSFINFDMLELAYRKIVEKSGFNPEQTNFLGPDKIMFFEDRKVAGLYMVRANAILLNEKKLKEWGKKPRLERLHTIKMVCHEEVHATAKTVCVENPKGADKLVAGYDIKDDGNKTWEFLNEGVTEKLAREIFAEYIQSTGEISEDEKRDFEESCRRIPVYAENVWMVESLVDRLALETGVSKNKVWQALIRGAYQGVQLDDPELKELIVNTLGIEFFDRLKSIDHDIEKRATYKVDELIRELREPIDPGETVRLAGGRQLPKRKQSLK